MQGLVVNVVPTDRKKRVKVVLRVGENFRSAVKHCFEDIRTKKSTKLTAETLFNLLLSYIAIRTKGKKILIPKCAVKVNPF